MNPANKVGCSVGRFLRSIGVAEGDADAAVAYAEGQNWIEKEAVVHVIKGGVGALTTTDVPYNTVKDDFFEAIRPYAVLSRLDKVRRAPIRTKMIAFGAGTVAYRVGERKNIPISAPELLGVTLEPGVKVAALTVATKETLQTPSFSVDVALGRDLAAAVGLAEDFAFIDPTEAGSVLNGAPTAVSAGSTIANIDADLQKAVELLLAAGGKLQAASWIMNPEAAAKLGGLRGTGGALAYPDVGPNGGELLKLPVMVSETADGFLALVDQSGIIVGLDPEVSISTSENAMLQMSDTPTDLPDAPQLLVSIFQTDCVAFKAVLSRSWTFRAGAGVYITGGLW